MVYNREAAARRAEASKLNRPGACQYWVRTQFDAPSAGDFDHDGDADAVDGWKSETKKHVGDRHPPRGVPVSYSGGSHGFGHRAISLGNGKIRTTDGNGLGNVATHDLNWPETAWGLTYSGWSETIDGVIIPLPYKPPAVPTTTKRHKDFRVHLVPGNSYGKNQVASIKSDMGLVKKKTAGGSAVVFNTERKTPLWRKAVSDGLGKDWRRVIENENTIAYGFSWVPTHKPTTLLLAKADPSLKNVSPRRYLDKVYLENKQLKGVKLGFFGTHLLSEANCKHVTVYARAWREKWWHVQLNDVINEVERIHNKGIPIVLAGDLNTGMYFNGKKVLALLQKRFPNKVHHVYNGPLDHIFLISTNKIKLSEVGKEILTDNKSDHNMVTAVIRATVL